MASSSKSNKKLFIILGVVLAVLALAGWIGKQKGWIGKGKATKVVMTDVSKQTIIEKVSASGKIQPVEEVKISPQVSGEILELYVEEGDSVVAGQLLARIRPDNLISAVDRSVASLNTQKANYAQAKSRLAQAQSRLFRAEQDYERNKKLYDQKAISEQEYQQFLTEYNVAKGEVEAANQSIEAALFTVRSAEATVKEARENLSFTNIYAPMGGTVTQLLVEKGERVVGTQQMAGTEMMRIANLNQMEVWVNVNENDIIRVALQDTVLIDVDAYSHLDVEFKGVVSAISNSSNQAGTAASTDAVTEFEVKVSVLKSSYDVLRKQGGSEAALEPNLTPFRPGMTASVEIITERKSDVVAVPLASVTTRPKKQNIEKPDANAAANPNNPAANVREELEEVVFVVVGDTVKMVPVTTGVSDYEHIEILKGLELGEKIVQGPFLEVSKNLKQGTRVEPMTEEGEKKE